LPDPADALQIVKVPFPIEFKVIVFL
jgi:hypothetical protein